MEELALYHVLVAELFTYDFANTNHPFVLYIYVLVQADFCIPQSPRIVLLHEILSIDVYKEFVEYLLAYNLH